MVRFAARWFLLIFPGVFAASAFAQTAAPHVEPASHRAAHASPFAPLPQQLFGAIPLSTRSEEARKTLELAWDKYENAMYQPSAQLARQAAKKDPHSALSYALVSFAARRGMPDAAALAKAKALLSRATPDERLLVRWMTDDQDSLERYRAALQIDPAYISSQYGLGNTSTLMGDFAGARREYDRAIPMAQNLLDELYVKYLKTLVYFWEGQAEEGRKALAALAEEAAGKKEPNSQFQVGMAQAMLAADPQSELDGLKSLSSFLDKPLAGMNDSDRGIARAAVLRERVRVEAQRGASREADQAIAELRALAAASRNQAIRGYFESACGYVLFSRRDFANAADELAADPHSPLALRQLAVVQEKLGNAAAAEAARTALKYHRSSEAEWFLATHTNAGGTN